MVNALPHLLEVPLLLLLGRRARLSWVVAHPVVAFLGIGRAEAAHMACRRPNEERESAHRGASVGPCNKTDRRARSNDESGGVNRSSCACTERHRPGQLVSRGPPSAVRAVAPSAKSGLKIEAGGGETTRWTHGVLRGSGRRMRLMAFRRASGTLSAKPLDVLGPRGLLDLVRHLRREVGICLPTAHEHGARGRRRPLGQANICSPGSPPPRGRAASDASRDAENAQNTKSAR